MPSSHVVPIYPAGAERLHGPQGLADAFSEFIAASSQLESSYRDLQKEVAHLSGELAERNAALSRSLAGNDRMRATLQQMIDSMPCGLLVLNKTERIVTINPEARRLLAIGNSRIATLQELSNLCLIDFESKSAALDIESEVAIDAESGKRWIAISSRKLSEAIDSNDMADSSSHLQTIWILRDVTANKIAEMEREAARRTAVLAEISTVLAHEIRNPLASMELFAGLIADEADKNSEWISHLRAGIRTLSGTVNNVLSLNGAGNLQFAKADLEGCIRNGVEFVRPVAEQAGVGLVFHNPAESWNVLGNEAAIRQIVLNLCGNAIRHTSAGGAVEVSIESVETNLEKRVAVIVRDTGCGIAPEKIERIFEAGYSGSGQTTGLGLAVCKGLAEQHGGAISVSSRVNEGSTFKVEFPVL